VRQPTAGRHRGEARVSVHTRVLDASPARLLDLHVAWPERYPALLESVVRSGALGRFDLLLAHPGYSITRTHDGHVLASDGPAADSFLDELDRRCTAERLAPAASPLPFTGGWLVFVAYETAAEIEPTLRLPPTGTAAPQALALRIPAALIYDHAEQKLCLVAEDGREELLDAMALDLTRCPAVAASGAPVLLGLDEEPAHRFLDSVQRVQDYIAAGDVYQVNLSRAWRGRLAPAGGHAGGGDDLARLGASVYRALRIANPAPFAASVRLGDQMVLSSSPERLFSIRDGEIATRPIAGTRPRSGAPGADSSEKALLAAHPKERAEHVMLIDLERNDLGRVCSAGSVHVDELMVLESYEHVHHIVSGVRGRLLPGTSAGRVLRAVFPGGTITGCPKVRCMQIIAELEKEGRGAYTGSLGYLNRDGSGDLNILIRTMSLAGEDVTLRAGAGIVADSDPARELAETRAKARGLLRALGRDS
jgi:anthranilate synthase component I